MIFNLLITLRALEVQVLWHLSTTARAEEIIMSLIREGNKTKPKMSALQEQSSSLPPRGQRTLPTDPPSPQKWCMNPRTQGLCGLKREPEKKMKGAGFNDVV